MANTATAINLNSMTNQRITLTDGITASCAFGTKPWTVECWVWQTDSASGGYGSIFTLCNTGGTQIYQAGISTGELLQPYMTGSTWGDTGAQAGKKVPHGQWFHYVIGRIGDGAGIWIDGKLMLWNSELAGDTFNLGSIILGTSTNTSSYFFQGWIYEFRVSKIARYGNIDIPATQLNTTWQLAGRGQNALLPQHTKLLIQANSSTTTTDTPHDVSGNMTATTADDTFSQTQTNFGNCAIYFTGSTGLVFPHFSTLNPWSGDWSFEAWVFSSL